MLTSVVIQGGLKGLGIDSLRNRHKKAGSFAMFDLSVMSKVDIILRWILQENVDSIHAAPPWQFRTFDTKVSSLSASCKRV